MSGGRRSRRRQAAKATAQDHIAVPYLKVRDRFLEAADKTDNIEWLVAVGRFVQDRWLAEENERSDGDFDEHAVWHVWDKCTEKQLRDLRAEAGVHLKDYVAARGHAAAVAWFKSTFKPVKGLVTALNWVFWQFLRGLVSGIAIIVLGLILAAVAPEIIRKARGTADTLLPADTQPHTNMMANKVP